MAEDNIRHNMAVCLMESFIPNVLVIPFEICEISVGRNREEMNPMRKLRIWMTGNVGGGAPPINASVGSIEGFIGGRALVEMKAELGARGSVAEAPMPTYAISGRMSFFIGGEMMI